MKIEWLTLVQGAVYCPSCKSVLYSNRAGEASRAETVPGAAAFQSVGIPDSLRERYDIEEFIGAGSFAMVARAIRCDDSRTVAIKFLTRTKDGEARTRFLQEGNLLRKVHHPHVVEAFEIGVYQTQPYIVMEFVAGGTLRDLMRRPHEMSLADRIRITRECLLGLHACHQVGVVHRDLKPENILISTDGRAKISDLGIAKSYANQVPLTMTGVLIGTPRYMAPEQLRGESSGTAADLFSMGMVLHELVVEKLPDGPHIIARAELTGQSHLWSPEELKGQAPAASPAILAVIHRALAIRPTDRFATALDFERALGRALEPAVAGRPALATRPSLRRRLLVGALLTGMTLIALCIRSLVFKSEQEWQREVRRANAELATKKFAAAEQRLRALISGHPDVPLLHHLLSKALRGLAKPGPAKECLQSAIRTFPQDCELRVDLAETYLESGERELAIREAENIRRLARGKFQVEWAAATILSRAGRAQEAIAQYTDVERRAPGVWFYRFWYASALQSIGDWAGAEKQWRLVAGSQKGPAAIGTLQVAVALWSQGKRAEAERLLESLVGFRPTDSDWHYTTGKVLLVTGLPEWAGPHLKLAAGAPGAKPESLELLAECQQRLGNLRDSEEICERLIARYPERGAAYWLLGELMEREGKPAAAEGKLRLAIGLEPTNPKYQAELAKLLRGHKRLVSAEVAAHAAVRLDPRDWRNHHLWGEILAALGRIDAAEREFREAIAVNGLVAGLHVSLAGLLSRAGRTKEAIPAYRRAIELAPTDSGMRRELARALLEEGRLNELTRVLAVPSGGVPAPSASPGAR